MTTEPKPNQAFLKDVKGEIDALSKESSRLDAQIATLMLKKGKVDRAIEGLRAYTKLEGKFQETPEAVTVRVSDSKDTNILAALPLHEAAKRILEDHPKGLTNRQLVDALARKGKVINGPNAVTVIQCTLKRNDKTFKRIRKMWVLGNAQKDLL